MSAIPYTVERRPDTGVNNVQLGIWLFLASEVMLFGGLFSAYFTLRAGSAEPWIRLADHAPSAVFLTLNLLLVSSSFTLATIVARQTPLRLKWVRGHFVACLIWALSFCIRKWIDYSDLFEMGRGPSTSTHMAMYFLLTGVHVLHIAGGMVATMWLAVTSRAELESSLPTVINRMKAVALYWYFVDAVWLVIFVLFYVF
jgi:heme/copper-type cytochrome/quinol oxidase subunit 3